MLTDYKSLSEQCEALDKAKTDSKPVYAESFELLKQDAIGRLGGLMSDLGHILDILLVQVGETKKVEDVNLLLGTLASMTHLNSSSELLKKAVLYFEKENLERLKPSEVEEFLTNFEWKIRDIKQKYKEIYNYDI